MEKVEKERSVLDLAMPLLKELYGSFDIVSDQLDKPDAAIILKSNNKKIGIEITSVDKQKDLQYFNDKKDSREIESQQLNNLQKDGSYSSQPNKKLSIAFPHDYIVENVLKKEEKYIGYKQSSDYDEIIILAFSSYLEIGYEHFENYHKPWTNLLLSQKEFPFDKVIFACSKTSNAMVVYDKNFLQSKKLKIDSDKELGITVVQGPIFPAGKTVNILKVFNEEPLLKQMKSRNKAIKERKAKKKARRKSQKKARKINSRKA